MQQTAARGAVGVAGGRGSEPLTPDNLSAGTPEDLGLNQTETELKLGRRRKSANTRYLETSECECLAH